MADVVPNETPAPIGFPARLSWIQEVVASSPGHVIMSALFIYGWLYVYPNMQDAYEARLQNQRVEFLKVLETKDERYQHQLAELQTNCYETMKETRTISEKNTEAAKEILATLSALRTVHP